MPRLQAIAASIRKRLYDNFAGRTDTTGSLGTATDGSLWTAVNGTLQVASGQAVATTTPPSGGAGNSYPLATVNMPTSDNVIKMAGVADGSAAAIWVQSGTDWWMVDVEADTTVTANYSYAYQYYWAPSTDYYTVSFSGANSYAQYNVTYGFVSTSTATRWTSFKSGTRTLLTYASTAGSTAWGYAAYSTGAPVFTSTAGTTRTTSYSQAANQQLTQTYTFLSSYYTIKNEYLKIRQSVSNVVSVISSQLVSTSQSIASFLVSIAGNVITARAYSDTNFVTQIGTDLVYTATGATITTQYGISLAPSAAYQNNIVGTSVDITRG